MISASATDGAKSDGAGTTSFVDISHSEIVNGLAAGTNGVTTTSGSTTVGDTTIAYTGGTAFNKVGGGLFTYSDNRVHDVGAVGTPTPIGKF